MKLVVAIVQPFKLEEVEDALKEAGVAGMTITRLRVLGTKKGIRSFIAAPNMRSSSFQRRKSRLRFPPALVDKVVDAIVKSARTGQIGDGKIFVTDIEETLRIRTGESGSSTLTQVLGMARGGAKS
jgi:nitrogen regulatory protein P-II 2